MSSRLLSFSLCLNLVLLGMVGYRVGRSHLGGSIPTAAEPIPQTNRLAQTSAELAPMTPAPLRWSELESEDYPTYVVNLRRSGCPEPVLRQIIGADLKDLYARKAFALVREFHRDFWEIAARENVREYFEKKLRPQVKAFCNEPDVMLNQLVGEAPREPSSAPNASNRFTDFLSPAKQEQLRLLAERYEPRLQAISQANLSSDEEGFQLAQLRTEMGDEQAQILSPEELAEYQLRRSIAACEVQHLHGVDFSETELRNMAKAIDDYHRRISSQAEDVPETLDQKLQTVLGQARFSDFNRARSASYRELYEVVTVFGQPAEIAADIFDLRLKSERKSDEIRADKIRSPEEKQAFLDETQEQVEQAVQSKMGAGAFQSYNAENGRWINALGRL